MLKNVTNLADVTFSSKFISSFKKVLKKLYHYESYMDFLIIPSILNKKTLSYIPLLNYTDRYSNDVKDLLELGKENEFQIRALNFDYTDFKKNDTVTMRIETKNQSSENLFANSVKSRCRNKIRNSIKKQDFTLKYGNDSKSIDDFYKIFSETMYKHGTPVLDKNLFISLADEFKSDIIFYNAFDKDKVIATMCIMIDGNLAWYPWGGVDIEYSRKLAGYFIYWKTLQHICDTKQIEIFDFGRSSYGGSTYNFKSQFGAKPIKIDIIRSNEADIYSKYSLASNIWKKLPKNVVDFIGPKICKYLVDL